MSAGNSSFDLTEEPSQSFDDVQHDFHHLAQHQQSQPFADDDVVATTHQTSAYFDCRQHSPRLNASELTVVLQLGQQSRLILAG